MRDRTGPRAIQIKPDGTMIFKVGDTPTELAGYTQMEGNPCVWIPDFAEECKYRGTEVRVQPCKALKCVFVCSLLKQTVNQNFCNSCDKVEQ